MTNAALHDDLPRPLPAIRLTLAAAGEWSDLLVGLKTLGFSVYLAHEPAPPDALSLIIDGDATFPADSGAFVVVTRKPTLAAAAAAIAAGASGYFPAPVDCLALAAAVCGSAQYSRERLLLETRETGGSDSAAADQTLHTVVGILMERFRLSRAEAYQRLRQRSRVERRKLNELAREILGSADELGQTMRAIASTSDPN